LRGGASSLTYAAEWRGQPVAVKVAPPGLSPTRNRDVLRQARIMRLLADTDVPVPEVLWEDPGRPPERPPLFVMSFVDGTSVEPLFDDRAEATTQIMAERLRAAARLMATLHGLAPGALRLSDEPVGAPRAEIERWCRVLRTVDPPLVAGWEDVAAALRAATPTPLEPVVVHGDFRLGNLLATGATIKAVLDWEIWSLGDPRVDVGWFLLNADPDSYGRTTPYTGRTPSVEELARLYARSAGRAVADLRWFQALAAFKSAATWSLIVKHNRRRTVPDAAVEAMVPALGRLLELAARLSA
jgi:aminoglycoside phosphotransferase (APT) family kinase protein